MRDRRDAEHDGDGPDAHRCEFGRTAEVEYERDGKSHHDRQTLLAGGADPDRAQVGTRGEAGERDYDKGDEDRHAPHASVRGARKSRERARTDVGVGLTWTGTFVTRQPPWVRMSTC